MSDICIFTFGLSAFQTIVEYLEVNSFLLPTFGLHSTRNSGIFTARKRSSGQGNVFAPVCHSVHRVSLCMMSLPVSLPGPKFLQGGLCAWSHVLSPDLCAWSYIPSPMVSIRRGGLYEGGLCEGCRGVHVKGISLKRGVSVAFCYGILAESGLLLWHSGMVFCYDHLTWHSGVVAVWCGLLVERGLC